MSDFQKILIPLLIAGAGIWYLRSRSNTAGLGFSIRNVFIGNGPSLVLSIAAQNSTDRQFSLQRLAGEVRVNDLPVGSVQQDPAVFIVCPTDESLLQAVAPIALRSTSDRVISLIQEGNGLPVTVTFSGSALINGWRQSLNLNYKLV
jgi:hypothetical protein